MNNPLIEEVRAARAARAASLDYDPHKIAEWARNAHAERQKMMKSKNPNKAVVDNRLPAPSRNDSPDYNP